MINSKAGYHPARYLIAWLVHAFTASAAFLGVLTLIKIYQHEYKQALWCMALTVIIDALDGTFARLAHVKKVLPNIDGALLDNLVDYLNYVITPCFFLFVKPGLLPSSLLLVVLITIIGSSSYQFCQNDAKTPDHFFKGFPCYWNIIVFYMFIFHTSMQTNVGILFFLSVLVFVPIKYVYPSRLDYLTSSLSMKVLMHIFSAMYGIASAILLWNYPTVHVVSVFFSCAYIVMYIILSIYRTFCPLGNSQGY